ncbi:MAG: U32 family peptidase [Gemmatimonadaceae bacterium]|nr:U32 family peptidase [Gemmatimonadaceae bacterium]
MPSRPIPELLSPAGSLDAARAAIANGADAIYLGAERFNARDDGAQLTLEELDQACRLAHSRGARVYLTLNTLIKPHELADALGLLGECIVRGIDAVIVQDLGLVRLIRGVYPELEIHGSTQMTVHDGAGAAVLESLGVQRVVLARENTLSDIRAIRSAVPGLSLESFVHGALCISYSGQCYMSGMISERSANRGSCAQSCRKDYTLTNTTTGATLDTGFLISARDLSAEMHLEELAEAGIRTIKVEGRKKKPEYVATVTRSYRAFLDQVAKGEHVQPLEHTGDLVQIFSRGFTGGMYGGRAGREYITRDQPDNRGVEIGVVTGWARGGLLVELTTPLEIGDGIALEPPCGEAGEVTGFTISSVRTLAAANGTTRQVVDARMPVPNGWRVVRTSHAALLARARESFASLAAPARARKTRVDVRAFGSAGSPLKLLFTADGEVVEVRTEIQLAPANKRALDQAQLREQLGRTGETPFVLGAIDDQALASGLFIPVSELNGLRQRAIEQLMVRRDWAKQAAIAERSASIEAAVSSDASSARSYAPVAFAPEASHRFVLAADVCRVEDGYAAADAGATEVALDPFLRHPLPPVARVARLASDLAARGITFRLRTPTIVRPDEHRLLDKWLALGTAILTGHLGLMAEVAREGRDVVGDYALNVFNQHTASELFALGASRLVLSVELTGDEIASVTAPRDGAGFDTLIYGRPEGMTIEHCVLSAAFDREPASCRDLCVRDHPLVQITDPAGYTFAVATDSNCRNRLLHSRPIEGSEFLPRLWSTGIRAYRMLFNVPGDPVSHIVARYLEAIDALASGATPNVAAVRELVGTQFTRGHFARAV